MALLLVVAVALCGPDHLEMIMGDAGHGQAQEDHGCSSDPFVRAALEGPSPDGPSGIFPASAFLLVSLFGAISPSGFDSPSPPGFSNSFTSRFSNKLYQRHAVYRI